MLLRNYNKDSVSGPIGDALSDHLVAYCRSALGEEWVVRDLDCEPHPGPGIHIADIAIWHKSGSLLFFIEAKTGLYKTQAQLGDQDALEEVTGIYKKAFKQIGDSKRHVGNSGFLAEAPTEATTFGLCVTFDDHFTTVVEGETHFGLVLPHSELGRGLISPEVLCRVVSSSELENLVDLAGMLGETVATSALEHLFSRESPLKGVSSYLKEVLEEVELPDCPPNAVLARSFDELLEAVPPSFSKLYKFTSLKA